MGLSTAWGLARGRHEVLVLDQAELPNPRASSSDEHRLIRYPYGAAKGYARMVQEAYGAWEDLWRDVGERLYARTGTLVLDSGNETWARESAASLEQLGLEVKWLDPEAVERRFPWIVPCPGFYLESGGVLFALRIVERLLRFLAARGVEIRTRSRVTGIDVERALLKLENGDEIGCDVVVVAAGAWVGRLFPSLGARLIPSRQVVLYLEPPADLAPSWSASPMILDIAKESGFYLVPPVAGTSLKVGDHRFSLRGDPDDDRQALESEWRSVERSCRSRLRAFEGYRFSHARVCFYTVEPEERFVIGHMNRAWLLSACSGHGFKFGPLLGLRLAEAIEGKRPEVQLVHWAAGFP